MSLFYRIWPQIILSLVGFFLFAQSYKKWGDLIIDLGHNLYIPGRLLNGDLLYRDIIYNFGPVTPYVLTAAVWLFGNKLITFEAVGILVGIAVLTALFMSGSLLGGKLTAFLSALLFLVFSFFSHSAWGANFVLPFTFAATLSTAFSCWSFYFLLKYLYKSARTKDLWIGTALMYAAIFTKIEVGAAIFGVFILASLLHRLPLSKILSILLVGSVLCCLFLLLFSYPGGHGHSLFAENIGRFMNNEKAKFFYAKVSGFDAITDNLSRQFISLAKIAIFLLLAIIAGGGIGNHTITTSSSSTKYIAFFSFIVLIILWGYFTIFSAIPIISIIVIGYFIIQKPRDPIILISSFVLFSSLRILLNYYPAWYGFYLIVPAYLFIAYNLANWTPRHFLYKKSLLLMLLLLAAIMLRYEIWMRHVYGAMTSELHTVKGEMRDFPTGRAEAISAFLDYMHNDKPHHEISAVVFPEGITLNYFTDIKNPLAYYNFIPPEIASINEEQRILSELKAMHPEYIIMANRDMSEFGYKGFGVDYAIEIKKWINQNYFIVRKFCGPSNTTWHLILLRNISLSHSYK